MTRSRGVGVVVLLGASGALTLKLMGPEQWVQAILVIAVELCLGVVLHSLVEGDRRRRPVARRGRPDHHDGHPPRKRRRAGGARVETASALVPMASYRAECRLLLPVRDGCPGPVDYAIRESLARRAELDLLFVRVLAALPMSPGFEPTEADDPEALAAIGRARRRAEAAGVPFRSSYAVTSHPPAAILVAATARGADLVVLTAPRRGRLGLVDRLFGRDDARAVLDALPDRIGLLIHA